ncbi:mannose-6-phosphate isomerase, class I [Corynebacterium flavescens]
MQLLDSATRNYSWGSKTLIPHLQGKETSDKPVAELWYGAHPADPSSMDGQRLDAVIAADPRDSLGRRVEKRYGERLPFLLKILAAAEPLSLQAHPSKAQAEEGFERENRLGISLQASNRNYKDDNHKPELIVALTPFYAMAGFRPLVRTRELFDGLSCSALDHYLGMLDNRPEAESDNLRALFTTWITIPSSNRKDLIAAVIAAGEDLVARLPREDWRSVVMSTVIRLNEQYPGDIGVLGALLLNHVQLQPGEAAYLNAGELHAYVSGLGVEIMANSDNVLRGGLTPKFVDVPELVKVLTYKAAKDPRVEQVDKSAQANVHGAAVWSYPVPIEEFIIDRVELKGTDSVDLDFDGPAIVLCTGGEAQARDINGTTLQIAPSNAIWLPASEATVSISAVNGGKAEVFVARV